MDSWDQQEDPGPGNVSDNSSMSAQFSTLNVNAKPFIPNVNAPEFVPSFSPQTEAAPAGDGERSGIILEGIRILISFKHHIYYQLKECFSVELETIVHESCGMLADSTSLVC